MSVENKAELVAKLTPLQYHVTQEAGTERPFTGKYNKFYEKGTYICVVCSQELFSSDTKYDSGCGWPAFNDVLDKGKVTLHADASLAGKEWFSSLNRFWCVFRVIASRCVSSIARNIFVNQLSCCLGMNGCV